MIRIEKAQYSDVADIVRLQMAAFELDKQRCGSGPPGCDDEVALRKTIDKYPFYLLKNNEKTLGGIYYEQKGDALHVIRVFICPQHQGQGLGRKLIEQAILDAVEVSRIELESPTFSTEAHGFYEHLGFKQRQTIQYEAGQAYLFSRDVGNVR